MANGNSTKQTEAPASFCDTLAPCQDRDGSWQIAASPWDRSACYQAGRGVQVDDRFSTWREAYQTAEALRAEVRQANGLYSFRSLAWQRGYDHGLAAKDKAITGNTGAHSKAITRLFQPDYRLGVEEIREQYHQGFAAGVRERVQRLAEGAWMLCGT